MPSDAAPSGSIPYQLVPPELLTPAIPGTIGTVSRTTGPNDCQVRANTTLFNDTVSSGADCGRSTSFPTTRGCVPYFSTKCGFKLFQRVIRGQEVLPDHVAIVNAIARRVLALTFGYARRLLNWNTGAKWKSGPSTAKASRSQGSSAGPSASRLGSPIGCWETESRSSTLAATDLRIRR